MPLSRSRSCEAAGQRGWVATTCPISFSSSRKLREASNALWQAYAVAGGAFANAFRYIPTDACRFFRSADERKGVRTCQMEKEDRAAFPNASRVVRVGDAQWSSEEDCALDKLMGVLQKRAKDRQPCALEALLQPPPRIRNGNAQVYLLYGPKTIYVDAENKLQADIRGLVYEKIVRVSRKGNLVINV